MNSVGHKSSQKLNESSDDDDQDYEKLATQNELLNKIISTSFLDEKLSEPNIISTSGEGAKSLDTTTGSKYEYIGGK